MDPQNTPQVIIATWLSLFSTLGMLVLGYLQLFRRPLQPKSQDVLDNVDASGRVTQGALDLAEAYKEQIKVITSGFQNEIDQLKKQVEELQKNVSIIPDLKRENEKLKAENKQLRDEITTLRNRLSALEGGKSQSG
ncbi:MAG TPA: hypothetical protein PKC99_06210 [Anaerolineales bacterium]|nr:hypothetical protein [Anaerolineales bacterium]